MSTDERGDLGHPRADGTDLVRWLVLGLVALRVVAVIIALVTHPDVERSIIGGDARRYDSIVNAAGLPYRDHSVEYPPGSVAAIFAVHGETLFATQVRLVLSQLGVDLACALVLAWGFGRRTGVAYLVIGAPFALFPFLYFRVDLVSVLLAAAAVAILHRSLRSGVGQSPLRRVTDARTRLGGLGERVARWLAAGNRAELAAGVLLALAVLTKIWPIALVPGLVVLRRWRALAACFVTGLVLGLAWLAMAGIDGVLPVVSFRDARGWQLESVAGIVVHVLEPARAQVESGAWRTGIMPPFARPLLTLLSFGTIALAWWWASRRGAPTDESSGAVWGRAPIAAVLGLLVFAPIISPQYVAWLLPFAAIAATRGDRRLAVLVTAAAAFSTLGLALIRLQIDGHPLGTAPVVARNVLLVWALAHALSLLAAPPRGGRTEAAPDRDTPDRTPAPIDA